MPPTALARLAVAMPIAASMPVSILGFSTAGLAPAATWLAEAVTEVPALSIIALSLSDAIFSIVSLIIFPIFL